MPDPATNVLTTHVEGPFFTTYPVPANVDMLSSWAAI